MLAWTLAVVTVVMAITAVAINVWVLLYVRETRRRYPMPWD